jgi:very-short-patch-repair endonuclease/predicted transcriptional regulator of viral defense system
MRRQRRSRARGASESGVISVDRAVADLAARQQGVVARAQLVRVGLDPRAIDRRLEAGRLRRLHRGVYLVGHAVGPWTREIAALLACGHGAVLSHWSAARLWSLLRRDGAVDITIMDRAIDAKRGVRIHRTTSLPKEEVRTRHGIPATSPARTVLDLAAQASAHELERAIAEVYAQRLATRDDFLDLLSRHPGRRGTRLLRDLVSGGETIALTRSEAERRLLALVRRAGLPLPSTNARLHGYEVDFLWRFQRLIVEVDGFAFHSSPVAFERDRRRDAQLIAAGYRVLRLTWRQIVNEPEATLVRLTRALFAEPSPSEASA